MSSLEVIHQAENAWADIKQEVKRQHTLWGEQNHPDGTGPQGFHAHIAGVAERYQIDCDMATNRGELTYRHIFLEEVFEAMAESDQDRLPDELVQVAAVAVSWINKIDRDKENNQ